MWSWSLTSVVMNNLKCLIADACENLNKKDIDDEIDSLLQL